MNARQLLLKLLPGLLPLFVFIVADELWGTKIGLLVAIGFGLAELIILWVKERRFDKFILFDTALIVALGGVSVVLDNDIFFKLKPGILGVILCSLLGVSVFTPNNFVLSMSKRFMKDVEFTTNQQNQLLKSLRVIFFILLFHTGLVFYSVWFMSKEAWVFISGVLFYILIGAYFAAEFALNYIKSKKNINDEWLPIVDIGGKVIGKATRSECHKNKQLLHPVVHLHVFNPQGCLYLQKRPLTKLIQPGKWDTAVGGHIGLNETVEQSLARESSEEIGISNFKSQFLFKYKWESDVESELIFCFATSYSGTVTPNATELDGGKFWTLTDIKKQLGKGVFTPNFEHEFQLIQQAVKI